MNNDLPEFDKQPHDAVLPYIKSIFAANFVKLEKYEDGHFRAIFKSSYFTLQEGRTEPSKSQWSTLKKKMKRHNKNVFVFKETGQIACNPSQVSDTCFYVDFGFFLY